MFETFDTADSLLIERLGIDSVSTAALSFKIVQEVARKANAPIT